METTHRLLLHSSAKMTEIKNESIDLVVTSPPYPMIEMWDEQFFGMCPSAKEAILAGKGFKAYEDMHKALDQTWAELNRVVRSGGLVCINIGDATRTLSGHFCCYPNHTRIVTAMVNLGFTPLPEIIWRKQSNAPNKFMGSGMLPAGAYVTQEHEYILIFRKGEKRSFDTEEAKESRRRSAFFWEERNHWFSDIWMDLKGVRQKIVKTKSRQRSGAFPFELAYRLINMYSVHNDTVLDPFWGTGTTSIAAATTGRNSIGFEIAKDITDDFYSAIDTLVDDAGRIIETRLQNHIDFIQNRLNENKPVKHHNPHFGFPVMTNQEKDLTLYTPTSVRRDQAAVTVTYETSVFDCENLSDLTKAAESSIKVSTKKKKKEINPLKQQTLF